MYVNRIEGGPSPLREPSKQVKKPVQQEGAEFADAVESILSNAVEVVKDKGQREWRDQNSAKSDDAEVGSPHPTESELQPDEKDLERGVGSTKRLNITA